MASLFLLYTTFHTFLLFLVLLLACVYRWLSATKRRTRRSYPPGPQSYMFLGNVLDIPTSQPHLTYAAWGKQFESGIVHVNALGQHIVIVNDLRDAVELLDVRASVTSGRPGMPMIEMMGFTFNTALLPYGDQWRRHRRFFEKAYRHEQLISYQQLKTEKVHEMLHRLIQSPQGFASHVRTLSISILMRAMYGHQVSQMNDPLVDLIEEAINEGSKNLLPGATLVNVFPSLRHLPSWMPGVKFKQLADHTKGLIDRMLHLPFQAMKDRMAAGTQAPSILSGHLSAIWSQSKGISAEDETFLKGVATTSYAAGGDTMTSSLLTFLLCAARNPEVQKKAQAEIDCVIGPNRLPTFSDLPNLPYCQAVYREVMRWGVVMPLGFPHAATEDVVYNGYFIPKGTYILSNIWAMTRNEEMYPDPERFSPERFLDSDGKLNHDNRVLTYGFGRRVCAGKAFASQTLQFAIVSLLATFDITTSRDQEGRAIPISTDFTEGVVSHPPAFSCSVTPRSPNVVGLVEESVADIPHN